MSGSRGQLCDAESLQTLLKKHLMKRGSVFQIFCAPKSPDR